MQLGFSVCLRKRVLHWKAALSEAKRAKDKFRGSKTLQGTFDQIMDRFIQACYQKFKDGKRSDAVMAADKMRKKYAAHNGLNDAYNKMFAAILDEADTISVPKPMKIVSKSKGADGRSTDLLAGLQGGEATKITLAPAMAFLTWIMPQGMPVFREIQQEECLSKI
ncbi:MAG: hypothetical protein JRE47_08865 [Deltaproteobacteria bacterium]|nr:hypothetical protein [Deltaproteobacteria bacterium]